MTRDNIIQLKAAMFLEELPLKIDCRSEMCVHSLHRQCTLYIMPTLLTGMNTFTVQQLQVWYKQIDFVYCKGANSSAPQSFTEKLMEVHIFGHE